MQAQPAMSHPLGMPSPLAASYGQDPSATSTSEKFKKAGNESYQRL